MDNNQDILREFDGFRLDTVANVLWYEGNIVPLAPKAVELLVRLTEYPGVVVSKDDLMDSVWGDAFVEESNLTHNIYLLRKTLGLIGGQEYIETVPRRGYRFLAKVEDFIEQREVTIERRVYSKTVIEEYESDESDPEITLAEPVTVSFFRTSGRKRISRPVSLALVLCGLITVALGAVVWTGFGRS
jgi:DNA-binding winged helix-turn-helix (wHTH) protein